MSSCSSRSSCHSRCPGSSCSHSLPGSSTLLRSCAGSGPICSCPLGSSVITEHNVSPGYFVKQHASTSIVEESAFVVPSIGIGIGLLGGAVAIVFEHCRTRSRRRSSRIIRSDLKFLEVKCIDFSILYRFFTNKTPMKKNKKKSKTRDHLSRSSQVSVRHRRRSRFRIIIEH